MSSYNKVVLMGNLTRDVELRYLQSGVAVGDCTLALNEIYKKGNDKVESTSFVDVTLWGRNAEVASEFCKKGSPLLVEGRLKQETWETDGNKRSKLKVNADRVVLVGSKNGKPSSPQAVDEPGVTNDYSDVPVDGGDGSEIPF